MRHTLPIAPQFYVTAPQPCPYLPGRMERKLFTALQGEGAQRLNDGLSKQGFRRSQNVLYRPSCADCAACLSARINIDDFTMTRSQRKTLKRNAGLERRATSPWATEEQYALFRRYLEHRHADGGMADMDTFEFAAMIEETPIRTRVVEYTDCETGDLVAVCVSASFAAAMTAVRKVRATSMIPAIPLAYIGAALVVWPFADPGVVLPDQWHLVVGHGAFITVSTCLLTLGPRYIASAEVALLILLESVLAPLLVWAVIGEDPGPWALAGGAVVIGVLFVSNIWVLRYRRRMRNVPQPRVGPPVE